jgi:hypothetical protein
VVASNLRPQDALPSLAVAMANQVASPHLEITAIVSAIQYTGAVRTASAPLMAEMPSSSVQKVAQAPRHSRAYTPPRTW